MIEKKSKNNNEFACVYMRVPKAHFYMQVATLILKRVHFTLPFSITRKKRNGLQRKKNRHFSTSVRVSTYFFSNDNIDNINIDIKDDGDNNDDNNHNKNNYSNEYNNNVSKSSPLLPY